MVDYTPLSDGGGDGREDDAVARGGGGGTARLASLDVFRGLSVALMIIVDYAGSIFPIIAHSPWHGVRLADFVLPFFLFIAGVSVALVYKRIHDKVLATWKALLRAVELLLLGVLLQGGYFHGLDSLSYGVDVTKIRWLGILQRIAIGYFVAALCEIWVSRKMPRNLGSRSFKYNYPQWFLMFLLSCLYLSLLYGLYVPDWQFTVKVPTSSLSSGDEYAVKMVNCSTRGDLGPACNSAGMIDRYLIGIEHLYKRPTFRKLRECSENGRLLESSPSWCQAPFDPEGILSSFMAAVTCIIGLQYGHILVQIEDHGERLYHWSLLSLLLFALGVLLVLIGVPLNKSLYTTSYTLITTSSAGIIFSALYLMVDMYGHRYAFLVLEWMGRHSLSIFVLVASNLAIIAIQGFYWRNPTNNIIHWVVAFFVKD